MSDFEGMALLDTKPAAGVLLRLLAPPVVSTTAAFGGVRVEVREGIKWVAVRGMDETSHEAVMSAAPELANRALDVFSVQGKAHLALDDVWTTHAAWWPDESGMVLRFWCGATQLLSMRFQMEVRDADGRVAPSEPDRTPTWEESMRYYRLSELTDDLFDAFRNVYLALESLLSVMAPITQLPGGGFESDAKWFKQALKTASALVNLSDYAVKASGNPVHDIYEELHNQVRHRIFHAKEGRQPFLPQERQSRALVGEAKDRYSRLYLALAERHFATTAQGGGLRLTPATSRAAAKAILQGAQVAITDDPAPTEMNALTLSPSGRPYVHLETADFPDPRGRAYSSLIGRASVNDLIGDVSAVGRLGSLTADGALGIVESLDGQFGLMGFDRLEVVFSIRVAGRQRRKSNYLM